ncbi:hypothetical protein DID73_01975 [Candidatus Marinamargulisbacteria bacterium SCGC AG-343-K17]|nr:hypothetical protein DID73_01975 [Candidatus Marinamargulisbacteria bacterium SCGC AG-343-K17]
MMYSLSYKTHLLTLSSIFFLIITLSITIGSFFGVKSIQLINKKIDNTTNILLLSNAVLNYEEFLKSLDKSNNYRFLLKEHKHLYNTSFNLVNHLIIQFELFNIESNNKERAIITTLYNIQTKLSRISFQTDQFIYRKIKKSTKNPEPFILFLKEEKKLLNKELILLSNVNQDGIKRQITDIANKFIKYLSIICIFGFLLFIHFKLRIMKDLNAIKRNQDSNEGNELKGIMKKINEIQHKLTKSNLSENEQKIIINEKSKQIQQVTEQLIQSQEAERQNISQFIHNDIGQHLTALQLETAILEPKVKKSNDLNHTKELIQLCLKKIKTISKYIHPPQLNTQPLHYILNNHANETLPNTIECNIHTKDLNEEKLSNHQKLALFRTFQEGITNIIRHAEATIIKINLSSNNKEHILTIEDNGIGIKTNKDSTGLNTLKHRITMNNGTFLVENKDAALGTLLKITLPFEAP